MIIPASQLWPYLSLLSFPVDVLDEKAETVVFRADRERLEKLVQNAAVIGTGTKNRIKRIRLNTLQDGCSLPFRAMYESFASEDQIKGLPVAGDAIRLLMHRGSGPVTKPVSYPAERISSTFAVDSFADAPYQWPLPRPGAKIIGWIA